MMGDVVSISTLFDAWCEREGIDPCADPNVYRAWRAAREHFGRRPSSGVGSQARAIADALATDLEVRVRFAFVPLAGKDTLRMVWTRIVLGMLHR